MVCAWAMFTTWYWRWDSALHKLSPRSHGLVTGPFQWQGHSSFFVVKGGWNINCLEDIFRYRYSGHVSIFYSIPVRNVSMILSLRDQRVKLGKALPRMLLSFPIPTHWCKSSQCAHIHKNTSNFWFVLCAYTMLVLSSALMVRVSSVFTKHVLDASHPLDVQKERSPLLVHPASSSTSSALHDVFWRSMPVRQFACFRNMPWVEAT